jgi:hypothetical protein
MSVTQETLDVRVSKRILWFGTEAYPLPNITKTSTHKLKVDRGAAIRRYAISVAIWLTAAIVVFSAAPGVFAVLALLAVLAWIAVKTIRLIELLKLRLHELVIQTAAGSHRGLISKNGNVVTDLSLRITDAINDPYAEFQMKVENYHVGDNFTMSGNNNVNKVAP